ncbi:MAG: mannose-1-phosphate guanylyltransferase/mannose-6-phosphate isomerase [Rhodospirillaceae bacterium]|nr:mannose-1-phosphate guanylyltransferase/mannose-6-phosphate isomerase [Rhodospirillaceae bacterium]
MAARIEPFILSGGSGNRLWPLSRAAHPKQLLPLAGSETMLQATVQRVSDPDRFDPPTIICNHDHRFVIAEQLRAISVEPRDIVLEPVARNTAPAAAVAALLAASRDPEALVLILPSDHHITDADAFLEIMDKAAGVAAEGALVALGIVPTGPETGYGYIKRGAAIAGIDGCHKVAQFVEKPDLAQAEGMLRAGGYEWNSGLFLFRADCLLDEMQRLAPDIVRADQGAIAAAQRDLSFTRLGPEAFAENPDISFDHAVMEKTDMAAVVSADMGWNDIGSWPALWELDQNSEDESHTVAHGDVLLEDVRNSYVRAEHRLVVAAGVTDLVIVETADAVLVADRDRARNVKDIVDRLHAAGRREAEQTPKVYRPWGYYEAMDHGDRFQVKRICVRPGQKLSMQKHHHRAEHWIVVEGTAKGTRDDETILLEENQSAFIPIGVWHRLENPGKIDLNLIEVQSGAYLGEDDIERREDQSDVEG